MEKRADGADTSVLLFRLAVLFFASVQASTVFFNFTVHVQLGIKLITLLDCVWMKKAKANLKTHQQHVGRQLAQATDGDIFLINYWREKKSDDEQLI